MLTMKRSGILALALFGLSMTMGGCQLSCNSKGDNPVKETVDEIGDEVEDVAEEITKD